MFCRENQNMYCSNIFYLLTLFVVGAFAIQCKKPEITPSCTTFVGDIYGPVHVGDFFQIAGTSLLTADWLDIYLMNGKDDTSITPLVISIRFNDGIIVRNTFNKTWLTEERGDNLYESAITPFGGLAPGSNFEIGILVGESKFYISINGKEFATYAYRTALDYIKTIKVLSDVTRISQIDHRSTFPTIYPTNTGQLTDLIYFTNDVPRQFKPGHKIIMNAIPRGSSSGWFSIEFQQNGSDKRLFVYNPRFDAKTIVRNAMTDDKTWGIEEKDGEFPFVIDEPFKLTFEFLSDKIKFTVNDLERYQGTFAIRQDNFFQLATGLKVRDFHNKLYLEVNSIDHIPATK